MTHYLLKRSFFREYSNRDIQVCSERTLASTSPGARVESKECVGSLCPLTTCQEYADRTLKHPLGMLDISFCLLPLLSFSQPPTLKPLVTKISYTAIDIAKVTPLCDRVREFVRKYNCTPLYFSFNLS